MHIPIEAKCPKGKLHQWKATGEFRDAFIEVCEVCSMRMIWRKDEHGRIDNRKYLRAHLRSFAQPFGETAKAFVYAYGEKAYKEAVKKKAYKEPINWDRAMEDARKHLRELQKEKATI